MRKTAIFFEAAIFSTAAGMVISVLALVTLS
jgi:hypothetical protein